MNSRSVNADDICRKFHKINKCLTLYLQTPQHYICFIIITIIKLHSKTTKS